MGPSVQKGGGTRLPIIGGGAARPEKLYILESIIERMSPTGLIACLYRLALKWHPLKVGIEETPELRKELIAHVRKEIGPIATPDEIQFTDALPKTRSGKIMRRILQKIAAGAVSDLGDTSTLADPSVVTRLLSSKE